MTNSDQKGQYGGPSECNQSGDVQSYLISRYRDALKSGDKSFAKSCLLSTRLFSVNDPNITNEIYVMAKADGDISEAAKCFASMFENLFTHADLDDSFTAETLVVANQMREEIRLLVNELKKQHLRLRLTPTTFGTGNYGRQIPSVSQSPLLSPRLRMSPEFRSVCRDSTLKLDKHFSYTNKSFFYQQLFDNLNPDIKRSILSHSIDNCDNPFERCRLMILSISLFNDSVITHGPRLLKTLIDLSQSTDNKSSNDCDKSLGTQRLQSMCHYAQSMLVLDAIPLIFNLAESQNLICDLDELFQQIFNYYSEFCLERAAEEYVFGELHEGLRKAIAARILAKDINCPAQEENIEENLNISLNLLFDRFMHEFSDDMVTVEILKKLRKMVGGKRGQKFISLEHVREIMTVLELENDVPGNILFAFGKDESSSTSQTTAATQPPKGRGRPKKVQPVVVSSDDGVRRHLQRKAKETLFIFTSILQHMFINSSFYLRQTRSTILMSFDNPLANQIEAEISKNSSQRSSRAKNHANETTGISPSKKIKSDAQSSNESTKLDNSNVVDDLDGKQEREESPLDSEHSKKMDREIVDTLKEVQKCMELFTNTSASFEKLFSRFLATNSGSHNLKWYLRVHVDCSIISRDFDCAISSLKKIMASQDELNVKKERDSTELSTVTVSTGTAPSVEVYHLRALIQTICSYTHLVDKDSTLETIADLLSKIKQSGLLTSDENYSAGNLIDEYRIVLTSGEERAVGFLFFDVLSLIRYVVIVLMDILKRYVKHPNPNSDSIIGHTIVLSQFDWPNQVPIYDCCIVWIRANKPKSTTPQCLSALTKFTYPDFFDYILDPNILEDFMALLNEGITLDIKNSKQGSITTSPGGSGSHQTNTSTSSSRSSSGSTRSGKAITTRGVNKTFKEDLKVALIAQMKNSTPLIPLDLIAEFIRASLVPSLMSYR